MMSKNVKLMIQITNYYFHLYLFHPLHFAELTESNYYCRVEFIL